MKINHNEFLSYREQLRSDTVRKCRTRRLTWGAVGIGATIYFGSEESKRQLQEITTAFQHAHELGLFTVLWCYMRNAAFKTKDKDYM
jgi:class I fructose-bisphosphate aldolase